MAQSRLVHKSLNSFKVYKAFRPVWWFLIVMGQMPFSIVKRGTETRPLYNFIFRKVGILTAIYAGAFLVFTAMWTSALVGILAFFFSKKTKIPVETYDPVSQMDSIVSLERESMREILVPLIVLWMLMTITFSGFITVFWKGSSYVQNFNYWNRIVLVTDLDPTYGVRSYVIQENIAAFIIFACFLGYFLSGFKHPHKSFQLYARLCNLIIGIPGSDNTKFLRLEDEAAWPWFVGSFICLIYGGVGSRVQILPFLFYSMLLKNATSIWNERFRNMLKLEAGTLELNTNFQSHRRVDYSNLLMDHLVLVQLFKNTENTFPLVLIVYYCANNICIICDLYFLVHVLVRPLQASVTTKVVKWVLCTPPIDATTKMGRLLDDVSSSTTTTASTSTMSPGPQPPGDTTTTSITGLITETTAGLTTSFKTPYTCRGKGPAEYQFLENGEVRPGDINFEDDEDESSNIIFFVMLALLIYQVYVVYHVTHFAAIAYKQAMKGFQILRRQGFMNCKSKTEKNFLHTLVFSFARNNPVMMTGGGYFPLNKTLLLAMAANLVNFVVFLYQWRPDDWGDLEYDWEPKSFDD